MRVTRMTYDVRFESDFAESKAGSFGIWQRDLASFHVMNGIEMGFSRADLVRMIAATEAILARVREDERRCDEAIELTLEGRPGSHIGLFGFQGEAMLNLRNEYGDTDSVRANVASLEALVATFVLLRDLLETLEPGYVEPGPKEDWRPDRRRRRASHPG